MDQRYQLSSGIFDQVLSNVDQNMCTCALTRIKFDSQPKIVVLLVNNLLRFLSRLQAHRSPSYVAQCCHGNRIVLLLTLLFFLPLEQNSSKSVQSKTIILICQPLLYVLNHLIANSIVVSYFFLSGMEQEKQIIIGSYQYFRAGKSITLEQSTGDSVTVL